MCPVSYKYVVENIYIIRFTFLLAFHRTQFADESVAIKNDHFNYLAFFIWLLLANSRPPRHPPSHSVLILTRRNLINKLVEHMYLLPVEPEDPSLPSFSHICDHRIPFLVKTINFTTKEKELQKSKGSKYELAIMRPWQILPKGLITGRIAVAVNDCGKISYKKYLQSRKKEAEEKFSPLLGQMEGPQLGSKLYQEPLNEWLFPFSRPHLVLFRVFSFRDDGVGHLLFWLMKFVPVDELIWLNISVILC